MEAIKEQLTPHNLSQFTGTEQYFKHWTKKLVYTDGVRYIGANGAYWVIDLIASYQNDVFTPANPFQSWKIRRTDSGGFIATATDGNQPDYAGAKIDYLVVQDGGYTDLPIDLEFYLIADETFKAVLLLPSEY